jgi:hypothetical protein
MRWVGVAVVVALCAAGCEHPGAYDTGVVSESTHGELISDEQEERLRAGEAHRPQAPPEPAPGERPEPRTPDVWEGPEYDLGLGQPRHDEAHAPADE